MIKMSIPLKYHDKSFFHIRFTGDRNEDNFQKFENHFNKNAHIFRFHKAQISIPTQCVNNMTNTYKSSILRKRDSMPIDSVVYVIFDEFTVGGSYVFDVPHSVIS